EALDEHGPASFVLDGEITAADGTFSSLQARLHLQDPNGARRPGVEVEAHLFDLLVLDDIDVTRLPQSTRHRILDAVVDVRAPLFRSPALAGHPSRLLHEECAARWD